MSFQAKYALSIFFIFLLIFDFVGVSIICDEYLVVSIERICEKLQIPDEAAGASFLAFGSSAPEILIAIVSVASASGSDGPELGFSTVLGSAIIAFGLIPSLCRMVAPARLELELPALIRDVSFCLISFGALLFFMRDESIDIVDSGILLCFFPLYMLAIFLPLQCRKGPVRNKELMVSLNRDPAFLSEELLTQESAGTSDVEERESETEEKHIVSESILSSSDVENENSTKPILFQNTTPPKTKNRPASMAMVEMNEEGQENAADAMQVKMMMKGKGLVIVGEDGKETHLIADGTYAEMEATPDVTHAEKEAVAKKSVWSQIYRFLAYPFTKLFHYTCPNCAVGEPWEDWYLLTFLVSLIYLGIMSYVSVAIAEYISAAFGVPVNLEGSFVLAFGAQIPDTLASLSMARKGLGPGAVANAIGSQIINVLLGVGVPFFFYALTRGTPVPVDLDYESSFVMLGGLIAVIGCYVIISLSQIRRTYGNKWTPPAISKAGAIILFVIYVASTFTIIVYNLL